MGQLVSFQMPGVDQSSISTAPLNSNPKVDTLQSRVLKWTTNDITNSTLFKTQMQEIPMEFSSTSEYLGAFRVPLLEEVRTQLHQALEKGIKQGACVPVRITKMLAKKVKNQDPFIRRFNLSLSRDARRNSTVRSSDLILLCCGERPLWDSSRECLEPQTHHKYVLVVVVYARDGSSVFTADAYLPDGSPILEELHSPSARQAAWFAVLLGMSLIPAHRVWNSINKSKSGARLLTTSVMHDVLRINQQIEPAGINSLALPQKPDAAKTLQLVEEYCKSRRLNDSQRDSLKSTLAGLLTTDVKCHVRMVQGPPGTGKTAMLVPLISVLGCLQCRTLVSAPTNSAVIEVCKRMKSFFAVESKKEKTEQETFYAFCSRVEASKRRGKERRQSPIQLCEVVLAGSKGRMEASVKGNLLEKVFLPYRIERLTAALSPTTGWRGCVQSVETFLFNAPAQFVRPSEQVNSDTSSETIKARNESFWSFAKKYMNNMQAQMEKHLLTLTSELPRCYIDVTTSEAMISTLVSMKKIVNAMPSKAPVKASTWFSTTKSNPLSAFMANLSLSESHSSDNQKLIFLQARETVLTALASRPGCYLLATKQNPQGRQPKYKWLKSQIFEHATLVFSTVSAAGSPLMDKATFQCAIIDEASQLVEAESTIVSAKRGLKQLILVGDHKQLPATVISKVAEKNGYGRSLFHRLQSLKHGCRHMLNVQYRMKPEISHFPNSQFYENGVKDGPNVLSRDYGMHLNGASRYADYAFVNCRFGTEEAQQKGWKNSQEVAVVIKMVKDLGRVCEERDIKLLSIGVISPYAMQVEAVKQSLGHLHRALDVEVKTVDGFQGNERDVMIFTAVRANPNRNIGFVHDGRRLNVAITRGRYCVWVVGNAATLSGGGKVWNDLITDAKARNRFFDLPD